MNTIFGFSTASSCSAFSGNSITGSSSGVISGSLNGLEIFDSKVCVSRIFQ
jgi:hypothetical protein